MCAVHCVQLLHTILHRTDLIIFPLALQTSVQRECSNHIMGIFTGSAKVWMHIIHKLQLALQIKTCSWPAYYKRVCIIFETIWYLEQHDNGKHFETQQDAFSENMSQNPASLASRVLYQSYNSVTALKATTAHGICERSTWNPPAMAPRRCWLWRRRVTGICPTDDTTCRAHRSATGSASCCQSVCNATQYQAVIFHFHHFNSIPILFLWANFSSSS